MRVFCCVLMKRMKVRKYFRGSGRVLAFVFIASVIWLLFDMAALRLSMSDNSSVLLLKQRVVEERLMMRSQTTKMTLGGRGGEGQRPAVGQSGRGVQTPA